MSHYNKFKEIHDLLKEYSCKPTFDFEKEYTDNPTINESNWFYQTLEECKDARSMIPTSKPETIHAKLVVVVHTKMDGAECQELRFDIEYSEKVNKYSMYISLPTHSRSVPLSKGIYKNQNDVLGEVTRWLLQGKCKKVKPIVAKEKPKQAGEQQSLF